MIFYKSKQWLSKRKSVLRRDEYLCAECKRYGRTTAATIVHHVKPMEVYPELRADNKNLISVCETCHNKFHDRATGALTAKGSELVKRVFGFD